MTAEEFTQFGREYHRLMNTPIADAGPRNENIAPSFCVGLVELRRQMAYELRKARRELGGCNPGFRYAWSFRKGYYFALSVFASRYLRKPAIRPAQNDPKLSHADGRAAPLGR
jgi:hypothetical protein